MLDNRHLTSFPLEPPKIGDGSDTESICIVEDYIPQNVQPTKEEDSSNEEPHCMCWPCFGCLKELKVQRRFIRQNTSFACEAFAWNTRPSGELEQPFPSGREGTNNLVIATGPASLEDMGNEHFYSIMPRLVAGVQGAGPLQSYPDDFLGSLKHHAMIPFLKRVTTSYIGIVEDLVKGYQKETRLYALTLAHEG
ncbi:hypothetical protein TRICI_000901 [Trichomonascus ciferrii]|uniref:Uncharacterized protein n=1 Tax=Trichomonascus ciferrii TaxID=44093 RepID=A0A642VCW8_9ASCO|nr:hypothetical protein TRICI_000901 [Trichomonascus ciferrii]